LSNNVARTRVGFLLVTALVVGFAGYPFAVLAEKLSTKQCSDAQDIAFAVMKKYAISPRLATSFRKFRLSNCDLEIDFERDTAIDETAFGEFRLKLIALTTAR
jgi:hypothetical protein